MDQRGVVSPLVFEEICRISNISPRSIALSSQDGMMSYEELERKSSQFAGYLAESGIHSGATVAICMMRSPEWIVAALGVLRSGAAYVPLDPTWPEGRIRYALEDSSAAALIAPSALLSKLQIRVQGIDPVRDAKRIAEAPAFRLPSIEPESLAYVIYTSGSTGAPKGVEITHANLSHLIGWHIGTFRITEKDRGSHLAGLAFDAAVWEIWPTLAAGATLCIPNDMVRLSPELIQEWMVRERVTIGFVPTVHAVRLIDMKWPAETVLQVLLTGGDALPNAPTSIQPFTVVNNYGPTECTVVSTSGLVEPQSSGKPSIGKAIPGTRVYLLDEEGLPTQEGQVGEIYIGGDGVGRGYRNLPDATRVSFLPDPFSSVANARMYRTGDRGSRRADGQIFFHGRNDRQVKIRGQRIELDEISNQLGQHPAVQFAIVTVADADAESKELAGYVLFKDPNQPARLSELQEHLLKHLPNYMVPTSFFQLKELPVSSNGKIDLSLLSKATKEPLTSNIPAQYVGSQLHSKLLTIVRELLKNPKIGLKDNFFLAGGHSLLGMQLIMRLRESYKVDLSARELFDSPTVEQLSDRVGRKLTQTQLAIIWKEVLNVGQCGTDANFVALGGDDRLLDEVQMRIASQFGRYFTRGELAANQTLASQTALVYGVVNSEALLPPGAFMVNSERKSSNIFWLHYPNPRLAEAMGTERPFLCLTLTEQDFEALGNTPTLQEIARCFVPKILASQPMGPYILGGFCLGGIVSYEVACQLQSAGYDVSLLALLDVPSPEYYRPAELRKLITRPVYVSKRFKQLGLQKTLGRLFARASEKIQVKAERALVPEHSVRTQQIMEDAAYRYKPTRYNGRVALIMAAERQPNTPPHEHFLPWWRSILPTNLHEHSIAAMHLELVDGPAVRTVAETISGHIEQIYNSSATR